MGLLRRGDGCGRIFAYHFFQALRGTISAIAGGLQPPSFSGAALNRKLSEDCLFARSSALKLGFSVFEGRIDIRVVQAHDRAPTLALYGGRSCIACNRTQPAIDSVTSAWPCGSFGSLPRSGFCDLLKPRLPAPWTDILKPCRPLSESATHGGPVSTSLNPLLEHRLKSRFTGARAVLRAEHLYQRTKNNPSVRICRDGSSEFLILVGAIKLVREVPGSRLGMASLDVNCGRSSRFRSTASRASSGRLRHPR